MSDEPVAYLGGDTGPTEEVDPYATAPPPKKAAAKAPASGDEEEVSGYLGGQAGEEDLPALPPAESKESYVAKDLLEKEPDAPEADPYADPYATGAADQAPAEAPSEYGDYEAPAAEADAAYFDSMGHSGSEEGTAEAPADEAPAEDYATDEADAPKTISQQDAESIIRRITTKRILPPESEKKPSPAASTKLTEARSGAPVGPIILVLLLLGGFAVFLFGEQIAEAVPELRPLLFWLEPVVEKVDITPIQVEDPQEVAKKQLLALIIKSEAKAFGVPEKDVPPAAGGTKPPSAPGTTPPPGTSPATTPTNPTTPGGTAPAPGGG